MKPLRVCHVIHNTEFGGTETMLHKIVSELAPQHEMRVISLMRCGEIGERIQGQGVPVHALNCVKNKKPRPDRLLGLFKTLRKFKPDVVQTWAYHADLCGGVAARVATRAAVLWNVRHATLDPKIDSKNVLRSARMCGRLSRWIPDRILLNANAAVDVHETAGYDRTKMQVIANGFDVEHFCPLPSAQRLTFRETLNLTENDLVLGMCGRFHPHKGQVPFVQTAIDLANDWPNAKFIMAGNRCDEDNTELTKLIDSAKLRSRFRLLGSRSDMPHILNAMDAYLLPSITEGMPNAVGEAMACGVPVVSTDVGDAKFLLGGHGQLVEVNDVTAMSRSVSQLFQLSKAERHELGLRGRQRIKDTFALDVIANQYESTWRETIEEKQARKRGAKPTIVVPAVPTAGVSTLAVAASGESSLQRATIPISEARPTEPSKRDTLLRRPKLIHVTTIPMTQWFFLRGQNRFMLNAGFDVHAISSPGDHLNRLRERDGVTTHEVAISRQITPARDLVSAHRLFLKFRELRPDIVQLSTPKAALLGAIAAKAARVPVRIYQVRGLSSESETGAKRKVFQRLERVTARLCNGHLVNASSLLQYAQRANILRSGIVAGMGMSNGVDVDRFDPKQHAGADMSAWDPSWTKKTGPVIGFVGRLTRDKGLEDLHSAWRTLREEFESARLLLVGPWESENATSQECRTQLEADPRVIMTGMQSDVAQFYKRMDVFAFPSHGTEGFPNAPMEAAAMGLPVIATRVVGCVDAVVHDTTGKIISPRSPHELEAALRDYMSSKALREDHGLAGRRRIETGFRPEDLWSEFRDYYFHLMRREGLVIPAASQASVADGAA